MTNLALPFSPPGVAPSRLRPEPTCAYFPADARRARALSLALVLAVHAGALLFWLMKPEPAQLQSNEMQVAVEIVAPSPAPAAAPVPVPEPVKTPPPKRAAPPVPVAAQAVTPVAATPTPPVTAAVAAPVPTQAAAPVAPAPAVPDTEPDYKAAYLNNPTPPYPLSARRMGIQGRVVLNVEVLAEGSCGQALVQQSSGYAMLDNSALQTVKGWRFIPARQAGQSVTKWFRIPINFNLKDNEA